MTLLRQWSQGFCPLNAIEQSLSDLIDSRSTNPVERMSAVVTPEEAIAMLEPGDILIDSTGSRSLLRDNLTPPDSAGPDGGANTLSIRLEYALVITFLYGQTYDCNEYCKYYKNVENAQYKFIPAVQRTYYDGSVSHVTGIVKITAEDYEAMPSQFDGAWLRDNFPDRRRVDGPIHREDQGGDERRDPRRPVDRPDPARSVPCSQRDEPALASRRGRATTRSRPARCFLQATRRSALRTSSRSRSASSARCSLRGSWLT